MSFICLYANPNFPRVKPYMYSGNKLLTTTCGSDGHLPNKSHSKLPVGVFLINIQTKINMTDKGKKMHFKPGEMKSQHQMKNQNFRQPWMWSGGFEEEERAVRQPEMALLQHPSEKAMAPHSSTLAWKIPWTGEPGGLQSMGSLRVGHNWATSLSLFTFMHWRRKCQPTPVFLPGVSQRQGSLVGCRLWGHTESDTAEVT